MFDSLPLCIQGLRNTIVISGCHVEVAIVEDSLAHRSIVVICKSDKIGSTRRGY